MNLKSLYFFCFIMSNFPAQAISLKTILPYVSTKTPTDVFYNYISRMSNVNEQDEKGNTLIMYIIQYTDNIFWTQATLIKGADLSIKNNQGNTALHVAITYNRVDQINLLISYQHLINIKNNEGMTPLALATSLARFALLPRLVLQGADPKITDNEGRCCLCHLCKVTTIKNVSAILPIIKIFMKAGASITYQQLQTYLMQD